MACGKRVATNSKRTNKEMNRVIKFRGKRLDNGEWCYGYYTYCNNTHTIQWVNEDGAPWWADVDPATVGQYTELSDSNGKEIYEGDIITVKGNYPRVVLWDKVSWALMPCEYFYDKYFWVMNLQHPGNDWWEEFADEMEVVGNIHDNPELLKCKYYGNNL